VLFVSVNRVGLEAEDAALKLAFENLIVPEVFAVIEAELFIWIDILEVPVTRLKSRPPEVLAVPIPTCRLFTELKAAAPS